MDRVGMRRLLVTESGETFQVLSLGATDKEVRTMFGPKSEVVEVEEMGRADYLVRKDRGSGEVMISVAKYNNN